MAPADILQALASMELDERVQVLGAALAQTLVSYRQDGIYFIAKHGSIEVAVYFTREPHIAKALDGFVNGLHGQLESRVRGEGNGAVQAISQMFENGGRS